MSRQVRRCSRPFAGIEVGTLIALFLFALTILGFASLADETMKGDTDTFDRTIVLSMRNPTDRSRPIGPPWLQETGRDVTSLGSTVVLTLVCAAVVGFLGLAGARGAAVLVATSVTGGILLVTLLKDVFARTRPDFVLQAARVFTTSFPSGHATMSAITYLTLGALLARVQPDRRLKAYLLGVAIALTMLVGISRVYLGVHWPTDVLAGWCIGSAWAIGCWFLARWFQRRGQVETDTESPPHPQQQ